MSRTLKVTVLVPGAEGGEFLHFGAGARPPSWVVKKYADEDIWVDSEAVTAPQTTVEAPTAPSQPEQAQPPTEDVGGSQNAAQEPEGVLDVEDDLIGSAPAPETPAEEPAGNASLADWITYARSQGAAAEDLNGKSRNEIRAAYGRN